MTRSQLESLPTDKDYWADVETRVLYYIRRLNRSIPVGYTEKDIFQQAVERFFNPKNRWDSEKYPDIVAVLCMIISSLLSNRGLHGRNSDKIFKYADTVDEKDSVALKDSGGDGETECWDVLKQVAGSNSQLQELIEVYRAGIIDAEEVASYLEVPIEEIYKLKRKLKDVVLKSGIQMPT